MSTGKLLGVGARRECALAALVCSVAPVGAQGVRGIVRDSASGQPLAGAAVSVVDLPLKALPRQSPLEPDR